MKLILLFILIVLNTQSLRLNKTHHTHKTIQKITDPAEEDYNFDLKDLKRLGHHQRITVNLDQLVPTYKNLVQHKVDEEIEGEVDYSKLDIQEFDIDIGMEALEIPYSPIYKLGQGFDVKNGQSRGSPYILSQLNEKPESIEGQDGKIKVHTITSADQMANSLAAEASLYGGGWGVKMSSSFTLNKQSSIKNDEVIVKLTHKIDLGKSFLRQSSMMFTKDARITLSQDKQEFNKQFGSYYIVGTIQECDMDIEFKKKVKKEESKDSVVAKLKVDVVGIAGGSAGLDKSKEKSTFNENVDIIINYQGNDNKVFLTGLEVDSLQKAIIEFPKNCNGNIAKYILWPYEKCQSYLNVKDKVDQQVNKMDREIRMSQFEKSSPLEQLKQKRLYIKQQTIISKLKYEKYQEDQEELGQLNQARVILNEIFIKATILNRIIIQGLEDDKDFYKSQEESEDMIFANKLKELNLMKLAETATNEFNEFVQKSLQSQKEKVKQQLKSHLNKQILDKSGVKEVKKEFEEEDGNKQEQPDEILNAQQMITKYREQVSKLFVEDVREQRRRIEEQRLLPDDQNRQQTYRVEKNKDKEDLNKLTQFITVFANTKDRLRIQQIKAFDAKGNNVIFKKETTCQTSHIGKHLFSKDNTYGKENAVNGNENNDKQETYKSEHPSSQIDNESEFWSVDLGVPSQIVNIKYYPTKGSEEDQDGVRIILVNKNKDRIRMMTYDSKYLKTEAKSPKFQLFEFTYSDF